MPLIGDMGAYRVGDASVTALYAGDVKVWPLGPPPDRTASWTVRPEGTVLLKIDGGSDMPPRSTTLTVGVPQFPGYGGGNSDFYTLGQSGLAGAARIYWTHSSIGDIELLLHAGAYGTDRISNGIATSQWAGHTLRLTFSADLGVSLVEVIG